MPDTAERRPRRKGAAQDAGNVGTIVRPGCAWCGEPLPGRRRRFCTDPCRRRGQRAERITETGEFGRAAIRMIRQMARRVGASDIAEFGAMWEVMEESERAVTNTIDDLRAAGFSWADIGVEIGWDRSRLYRWRHRAVRDLGVVDSTTPQRPGTAVPA